MKSDKSLGDKPGNEATGTVSSEKRLSRHEHFAMPVSLQIVNEDEFQHPTYTATAQIVVFYSTLIYGYTHSHTGILGHTVYHTNSSRIREQDIAYPAEN